MEAFFALRIGDVGGKVPDNTLQPPPDSYELGELLSKFDKMPCRYSNLETTIMFENKAVRWHRAEVNATRELGLLAGSTVEGGFSLHGIDVSSGVSSWAVVYAEAEVAEILLATPDGVLVEARARTVYGTIVDPDSCVYPPETPFKELAGLRVLEILRVDAR